MGNFLTTAQQPALNDVERSNVSIQNSRKRRWSEEDSSDDESQYLERNSRRKTKLKKTKTTSQYIYNQLFEKGENSDVKICAFNNEWRLHKIYLRQANYFAGMFQSGWKESSMEIIDLQIPDQNVTKESLNTALGSLYSDDVEILPETVVSVLAAASLIQLEGLMEHCSEVMKEHVSSQNVCNYYLNARMYGQSKVERVCIKWLRNNLMLEGKNAAFLSQIEPDLMSSIISSKKLAVLQVEMDVYSLLKKWTFLRQKVNPAVEDKNLAAETSKYFPQRYKETGKVFLETSEGSQFLSSFKAVRICNIIGEFGCCLELERDGLIPPWWLMPLFRERWMTMLRVEQGVDNGPSEDATLDTTSLRCGRILTQDSDHCWRWNGYNFGIDLLVTYNSQAPKYMMLKRNIQSQRRRASVGLTPVRTVIYRLKVFSLNKKGRVVAKFCSGPNFLSLEKDDERIVLNLDKGDKLVFPLMVAATFKTVSPRDMGKLSYNIPPILEPPQIIAQEEDLPSSSS